MLPVDEPPITGDLIRARLESLTSRLCEVAERAGRDPAGFRIVAITKGFGVDVVRMAFEVGLHRLGENRIQEALPKIDVLPEAEWHMVGHLQSNKARPATRAFAWIHSIDSMALLRRVDGIAHDEQRRPRVLLQVNVAGEEGKSGFEPADFTAAIASGELAEAIGASRHAQVIGLMSMGRAGAPEREARAAFRSLRELRDRLQEAIGLELPELSMGMTADADAAVAEGATLVRIGTGLFGPRPD
jgi:pyridoxal phosphate enzyme (YggS family)